MAGSRQSRPVTLQEAAESLGVHYMTAYRYVRLGRLPASKVNGVWRVEQADVERLRVDAGPTEPGAVRRRAPWPKRLEARMLAGDEAGAWAVVEAAMASGTELEAVYLDLLCPALLSIGKGWELGTIDVGEEHTASAIASRVIGRLGPRFARRGRKRGTVVIGSPPGERHVLPQAIVADLLRGAGFNVHELGPDMPPASFARAVAGEPDLVATCLSVTTSGNERAVESTTSALRAVLPDDVPILLGGRAIAGRELALALGADDWEPDGRGLVAALEAICEGRRRPA